MPHAKTLTSSENPHESNYVAEAYFAAVDENGDGALTPDEFGGMRMQDFVAAAPNMPGQNEMVDVVNVPVVIYRAYAG